MNKTVDVCVVSPFRRPLFRQMISHRYPVAEPWDSPQFQAAATLEGAGLSVTVLPLQTLFPSFTPSRDRATLDELLLISPCRVLLFCGDHFVASRSTATVFGVEEVLLSLQRIGRSPITALMGRLATVAAEVVLARCPGLHVALAGECDLIIPEFVRRAMADRTVDDLPFVATRNRPNAIPERLETLEELPTPGYHLARPMIQWGYQTGRLSRPVPFSMRTSAGCAFHCKFCAGVPDWNRWRRKSKEQLIQEVGYFQASLGDIARLVFIEDELLTLDRDHVDEVVDVLAKFDLHLAGFYTHSRFLDFDRAKRLSQVFDRVYLGMDAADDKVLDAMGKRQTVASLLNTLQAIRGSGLGVHVECIVGSPTETRQSILKNLMALHHFIMIGLVDAANTYVFTPHPGTEYANSGKHYGFQILDGLDRMQESGGYPAIRTKHLTRNEIFSAYLIGQIVIHEAIQQVRTFGHQSTTGDPDFTEFEALFSRIAGESS